jgi:hypothetical protein
MEFNRGAIAMQQTADILHSLVVLAPFIIGLAAVVLMWWPRRADDSERIAEQRKQTALLERISAKLEQTH